MKRMKKLEKYYVIIKILLLNNFLKVNTNNIGIGLFNYLGWESKNNKRKLKKLLL